MIEIEKPKIETVELSEDGSYGKFVVEPLERGYGTTLGQLASPHPAVVAAGRGCDIRSNRRCSSRVFYDSWCRGRCYGDHPEPERSSLKIHSDEEKVFEIDAEGEGVVTAGDIRADSDVEILNPDLHIATLASDARLHMRIYARSRTRICSSRSEQEGRSADRRHSDRFDLYADYPRNYQRGKYSRRSSYQL